MKTNLNSSKNVYAKFPRVLCLIYFAWSLFVHFNFSCSVILEKGWARNIIEEVERNSLHDFERNPISIMLDLIWYLFFYIALQSIYKVLSLMKILAKNTWAPKYF